MKKTITLLTLVISLGSCDEFVTIPAPGTLLVQQNVFEDDATALASMTSVYIRLADGSSFADGYFNSITVLQATYADELIAYSTQSSSTTRTEFFLNAVTPTNSLVNSTWGDIYRIIYECNRILEGINASTLMNPLLKRQLSGEALMIRAFCHFYLVNLFGDVPLVINSDYAANARASRSSATDVYRQVINDLIQAKQHLDDTYPSADRVRINRGAATALLARAYLYNGQYDKAEIETTEIINKSSQYQLQSNLDEVFLKTSREAIWQLMPAGGSRLYTNEAALFILFAPPTATGYSLRPELYQAFDANDKRRANWIGSISSLSGLTTWNFAYKYKESSANGTGAEYSMVLRLAEQYLIRAEARAHENKLAEAQADINVIRHRAGLPDTEAITKDELLAVIMQERRVELFTEWGHRFFDLKRNGKLDKVLSSVKPNWKPHHGLLPLPQSELLINQNLTQNTGY